MGNVRQSTRNQVIDSDHRITIAEKDIAEV